MRAMRGLLLFVLISLMIPGAGVGVCSFAAEAAAESPVRKVGVVNLNRVFKEYAGTKTQEAKLEKAATEKKTEEERLVNEIRNLRDELALLNESNREKQRQTIDQKLQGLAQFRQQAGSQLNEQREESLQALLKEIEGIVTGYAKQNGFDLILTDRATLFFAQGIDITDEILTLLNQNYSKKSS